MYRMIPGVVSVDWFLRSSDGSSDVMADVVVGCNVGVAQSKVYLSCLKSDVFIDHEKL